LHLRHLPRPAERYESKDKERQKSHVEILLPSGPIGHAEFSQTFANE
jgi:hypothetical protein